MALRTVIVGLGRIAYELENDPLRYHPCTHAGALLELSGDFELVGVCDRNPEKIERFSRWLGRELPFSSVEHAQLMESARPDLAIIAASLPSHRSIMESALKAGVGAVVLEKPVAATLEDAKFIRELAGETGARVWVNFERRYHPGYRMVRELVRNEAFGEPRSVRGRVLAPPGPDGGPLLHDAVHWIDLLLWFLGRPKSVSSRMFAPPQTKEGYPAEITTFVQLEYPDWNAFLESGGGREYFEFSMDLDFKRGRIECGNDGFRFFKVAPSKRYKGFRELHPKKFEIPVGNPWLELYREVRGVMLADSDTGRPTANLADALAGMDLIHQCYETGGYDL